MKQRKNRAFTSFESIAHKYAVHKNMEYTGFEPVASTMRMWRAPSCANTPSIISIAQQCEKSRLIFAGAGVE